MFFFYDYIAFFVFAYNAHHIIDFIFIAQGLLLQNKGYPNIFKVNALFIKISFVELDDERLKFLLRLRFSFRNELDFHRKKSSGFEIY